MMPFTWEWIPLLTAAGAVAALARTMVLHPWMEARKRQREADKERLRWISEEVTALRRDTRRMMDEILLMRKEIARIHPGR